MSSKQLSSDKNFLTMLHQVQVTAMQSQLNDNAIRKSQSFGDYKKAYAYYCSLTDDLNLTNAEYSNEVEMHHTAGGIGYDYRVELIPAE